MPTTRRRTTIANTIPAVRERARELASVVPLPMPAAAAIPRTKAKKRKRAKLPQHHAPHDCSILSIDAAQLSGFAAYDRGMLRWYGECDAFDGSPIRVFSRFLADCAGPHVIVVERPFYMKGNTTSLGAGDKVWRELAKQRSFARRIVRVYPSTWRSRVLPKGAASAKRKAVQLLEQEAAAALVRRHLGPGAPALGAESAPAVMIGEWASYAPEVFAVLPKPRAKKQKPAAKHAQLDLELAAGDGR